ncbi:MAG: hypothetical protein JWN22_1075 [Nocardioides sp.]|jgi:hypothetical protein|nr:hypothetical protein [Nocardioides sp.]
MKFRVALLVVLALAASALLSSPPASAAHKWSKLKLSRHGQHWTSALALPLFKDGFVWVPGCAPARGFFVKNQSGEKAVLAISMEMNDPSGWLGNDNFRIAVRTGTGPWVRVQGTQQQTATIVVDKGEVVPVSVRVKLLSKAGNKTMGRQLGFTVEVRLSERT